MMFFVMIKPDVYNDVFRSKNDVEAVRHFLSTMKAHGTLVHAYVKIGGGYIYILHADSFADVRNAFRDSRVLLGSDCEIYEIDQKFSIFVT
jgi:hypothetical protein